MVVVHGGPGLDSSYLTDWLAPLSKHRQLVFYDQRACGRDATPPEGVTIESLIDQLAGVVGALGGQVGILGHSWGACLLYLALQRGKVTPSEVLLVSPVGLTRERFDQSGERLIGRIPPNVMEKIGELDATGDGLGVMQAALPYYLGNSSEVPSIHFATYNAVAYAKTLESLGHYDCRDITARLPPRSLLIYGERDIELPEATREIHSRVGRLVLPEVGHFAFAERPGEFYKATRAFMEPS